jgi:hypothetical protein
VDTKQKAALFEDRVRREAATNFPEAFFNVVERQRYHLKIRIELSRETFIDIFYNPKHDRTDFALVTNNQRIFGYDNLGGWHCHSVANPKDHDPCEEPEISKIFGEIKVILQSLV